MTTNVLKKFGFIRIALAASVGLPLIIATSANAQNPTPTPAAGEATTERVIITGSNIPTTETESALPVTVYSAEVLQKIGANTPAEGLRQLPSFVGNTATENDSNGGNGTAAVTLRGLGPQNTLTLINFRRGLIGDTQNGFVDINAIPISAVARVEILKDGDSSVYGSDAVAGVVNFILLNGPGEAPYQGGEIYSLYGNTTDRDARVIQGYAKGGVTGLDGKVSVAAAAEYYNRLDIFSRDRHIASTADVRTQSLTLSLGGGSSSSPTYPGRVAYRTNVSDTVNVLASTLVSQSTQNPMGANHAAYQDDVVTSYRVFDPTGPNSDPDRFNFRAFTPAIPGQEKADYYVTGRYKVFDDMLQIYGDILYAKTKQNNGLAPSPFSLSSAEVNTSPFNPFLNPDMNPTTTTDNQLQGSSYRLINELGNRRTLYDADYYRYTVGFNGEFNMTNNQFVSNWGYDSGFVYGRYQNIRTDSGDAKRSIITAGIAGIDTDGDGVADLYFDPLIGENAPVAGTANTYTGASYTPSGTHSYDNKAVTNMAAFIAHTIFKERDFLYDAKGHAQFFPELYQGGVGAAFGYSHEHLGTESIPDPTQGQNDQLGFNQQALFRTVQEVNAVYGELNIPIIASTQNLPWMRSVIFDFAYRYEEFEDRDQLNLSISPSTGLPKNQTTFNNGGNPRLSLRIQPIEDVVLRASWGQSFRSPTPFDLFTPPFQNFPQVFDAKVSGTFQPPNGVNELGNPDLTPEKTDSYAVGFVYTPTFVRNLTGGTLTMSVDFYQMYTKGLILSGDQEAQVLISLNIADPDGPGLGQIQQGDGTFGGPGLGITRGAAGGGISSVDSAFVNAGKRLVNGMDVNTVYDLPTSNWGEFVWTFGYNYFFTWKAEAAPGLGTHSFLGDYNNGTLPLAPGAIPYHKAFLRGEWIWRGWDFVMTGNYISSFNDDSAFLRPLPTFSGSFTDPQWSRYRRVTDYTTLDMQLGYTFKKPVTEAVATSYAKDAKDGKDGKSAPAPVGGADNGTFAQRMLWNTTITVGVNNAFDRQPPTTLGAFNDNYDTSLYSIRDRYYYVSLGKKF